MNSETTPRPPNHRINVCWISALLIAASAIPEFQATAITIAICFATWQLARIRETISTRK